MSQAWLHVVMVLLTTVVSALAAVAAVAVLRWLVRPLGRRSAFVAELTARAHRPTQVLAGLLAVQLALGAAADARAWRGPLLHAFGVGVIIAASWLVATLLVVVEDAALSRVRTDVRDNRHARRLQTQITVIRRITVAVVAVLALGAVLMTFPSARAAGASLLASAAVIGAIAALAAQSLLGNVFAGVQIAFSDAIRLEDVVIVDKLWGRIEEITLTYVVVHVWDDRRLILPTSYFLSHPFENWTRKDSALLGTIEIDLDWMAPIEPMREQLRRILEHSDLWDGRVCVLQVTDTINTLVRLRALVSASDAPTLWDLRCLVREKLVIWLQHNHPTALPRLRLEPAGPDGRPQQRPDASADVATTSKGNARLFGGSPDGEHREQEFSGPPQQQASAPHRSDTAEQALR